MSKLHLLVSNLPLVLKQHLVLLALPLVLKLRLVLLKLLALLKLLLVPFSPHLVYTLSQHLVLKPQAQASILKRLRTPFRARSILLTLSFQVLPLTRKPRVPDLDNKLLNQPLLLSQLLDLLLPQVPIVSLTSLVLVLLQAPYTL